MSFQEWRRQHRLAAFRYGGTSLRLTQDNSGSAEEAEHSGANWQMMLDGLKKVVEQGR